MNQFTHNLTNTSRILKAYKEGIDKIRTNYNKALELLSDYKYELRRQIENKISERETFLNNLPYKATEPQLLEYNTELDRLEDSLYKLDIFLSKFS